MTRKQAAQAHIKLLELLSAPIFSTGVVKKGDGYVINVVLERESPYGLPDELEGVPLVVTGVVKKAS